MPSSSCSGVRRERIRRVVFAVIRRRAQGDHISDPEVIASFPDLQPELTDELEKVQHIEAAVQISDSRGLTRGMERLRRDWRADGLLPGKSSGSRSSSTATSFQSVPESSPTAIGRYGVLDLLGSGGYGRVYLARDLHLDRSVAIKVPHRQPEDDRQFQVFLKEAQVAAKIEHPAIVPVYDAGRTDEGECYVVSKWIEGEDLAAFLHNNRPSYHASARIVMTIARALHHAHGYGLVHRDVKPANILLDSQQRPYLADFGLATTDNHRPTSDGCAGTPAYMSPEQARGETHRIEPRSDVFSLGVVLYELLTGQKPFSAPTHDELVEQIVWSEAALPRHIDPFVPHELQRICLKAMAKRAADRYESAATFAADLRQCLQHTSQESAAARRTREAPTAIVPQGLRPFDARDSSDFVQLVPGPRDRDELPESIRTWQRNIEARDPEAAFRVGLIYGPSGCGKTSLVQAGIIPRLARHVQSLCLTARSDDTETRLAERLRKLYPDLDETESLTAMLAAVRNGRAVPRGGKLLIVIDQFEQWLHGKTAKQKRELTEALRQCDGERLQCLIVVRDDFWLAVSRFLQDLEVDLVPGKNAALVDLFDQAHARAVLIQFGRAFGSLPPSGQVLETPQESFVNRAIELLTDEDQVSPARLSLFAEIVRFHPWVPATLRDMGGSSGIATAFLERTFRSRTANPQYRSHERAARAVLQALLPEPHSRITSRALSHPELLDLSGYGRNPAAFKELIRILDVETRLITPIDRESEAAGGGAAPRYYQLTHDSLVPAIGKWVDTTGGVTWQGRAESVLTERSLLWNAKRELRQLPSLREWLAIRLLTRSSQWSSVQREMMRTARRWHVTVALVAVMLLAGFVFARAEIVTIGSQFAASLQSRLAVVLLGLGRDESVWRLAEASEDATVRTAVIHSLSLAVVDPEQLIRQAAGEDDHAVAQAMLLTAGELVKGRSRRPRATDVDAFSDQQRGLLQPLMELYSNHPAPAIHSAAEWTLRNYGVDQPLINKLADDSPGKASPREWFVNSHGHTMVRCLTGRNEHAASLFISSTETTREQYYAFRGTSAVEAHALPGSPANQLPQTSLSWIEAAAYCNWLSERDGLPESEWCYRIVANTESESVAPVENYLVEDYLMEDYAARRGYRLPTEREWEAACRAGTTTVFSFGSAENHLPHYAVVNARELEPVGWRKPNDFGLFDMHGNAAEWCHSDTGLPNVARGGSFLGPVANLHSGARQSLPPQTRRSDIGFRVACSGVGR